MKKKTNTKRLSTIIILNLLVLFLATNICQAEEWSREGKVELFGSIQLMGGDEASDSGVTVEIEDPTVYGFGIGYNLSDHLNLNTDLLFGSADICAGMDVYGQTVQVEGDTNLFLWNVNLDYNILKGRFTPVATGGIGFVNFNGDFGGFEFSETNFSYNLGAGLRWDATDSLFLKAMYKWTWTEMQDIGDLLFTGATLSVGIAF